MSALRRVLRRFRRTPLPTPAEAAGPVYRVAVTERDVIGCRVCAALRELLTFDWSSDPARMNRLMDEGGCYPAAPSVPFTRLDHGDDVALFRMTLPLAGDPGAMPPLWFRIGDLVVEGANDRLPPGLIETPMSMLQNADGISDSKSEANYVAPQRRTEGAPRYD